MSVTVTISVLDVLKSFSGTFLLSTGGAVIGLVGGVSALVLGGGGGSVGAGGKYGLELPIMTVTAGFLLGSAASVYFFGWVSLLYIPAVLLAIAGGCLYFFTRK